MLKPTRSLFVCQPLVPEPTEKYLAQASSQPRRPRQLKKEGQRVEQRAMDEERKKNAARTQALADAEERSLNDYSKNEYYLLYRLEEAIEMNLICFLVVLYYY